MIRILCYSCIKEKLTIHFVASCNILFVRDISQHHLDSGWVGPSYCARSVFWGKNLVSPSSYLCMLRPLRLAPRGFSAEWALQGIPPFWQFATGRPSLDRARLRLRMTTSMTVVATLITLTGCHFRSSYDYNYNSYNSIGRSSILLLFPSFDTWYSSNLILSWQVKNWWVWDLLLWQVHLSHRKHFWFMKIAGQISNICFPWYGEK